MKENIIEMPVKRYPGLRNITGSIYHLILLHEIIRRYYINNMKPFRWSMKDIQEYMGFNEDQLQGAIKGIDEFVRCSQAGEDIEWVLDIDYTRKRLNGIYEEQW